MKKVLVIEDDQQIADLLRIHLEDIGFEVFISVDGESGMRSGLSGNYDLIVLDVMLPRVDGIRICTHLRGKDVQTPILILTAKSEETDKVIGLECGADDYMTKPFSIREFIARVKAILRRSALATDAAEQPLPQQQRIEFGELVLDPGMRKVTIGNKRVELTPKEFDLLFLLASNPGKSYNRLSLLRQVWKYEFDGYEHTVNSHINRLRTKIEPDPAKPSLILTTWGIGYRFAEEPVRLETYRS